MAMLAARLALKKSLQLQQQRAISVVSSSTNPLLDPFLDLLLPKQLPQQQQLSWFSSSSEDKKSDGRHGSEVTVSSGREGEDDRKMMKKKKSNKSWFPAKLINKISSGLWRNNNRGRDLAIPSNLNHLFSSGLGDALMNASDNLNRLIENLALPARLMAGQIKENNSHYKMRFEVPGLSKDEVKITIEEGVLTIKGEHKEEEDEECFYGYYDTSLLLPDDAKVEEIKAEMKDGVLYVTIPKTEMKERNVKEIQIN